MELTISQIDSTNEKFKKLICLTEKQTSSILGISPSTLSNYRKEGLGPEFKKVENGKKSRILYTKASICQWVNNCNKTA